MTIYEEKRRNYYEEVRAGLQEYKDTHGATNVFIAKRVKLDNSTIGKFLKTQVVLSEATLERIDEFVKAMMSNEQEQ